MYVHIGPMYVSERKLRSFRALNITDLGEIQFYLREISGCYNKIDTNRI